MTKQIRAVTFDVGGTLIEPWPSVGHVYAEVAARHGLKNISAEQLNDRFKAAWRARQDFKHSRAAWSELVDEVFGGFVSEAPSGTFFPELYERFAQPVAWRVFDDVVPALDALSSRGIRLGVISNWDARLRGLLESLELDRYFETFSISWEVGFSKPSRVIFDEAAARLGVPAHTILHVGDNFRMDVEGARMAGFHALQIRRTTAGPIDGEMRSLAELASDTGKFEQED